jgi:riboflavin-specific deaminase-like protein
MDVIVQIADVTERVWSHLLAMRGGEGADLAFAPTPSEAAALSLYSPLLARSEGRQPTIAQIGQSLDGRISTISGDARDISGADGLAHLHRLRALCDAVVIGVRTALHDRPRLTVRLVPGPSPARVVIDPDGRLPDDAPCLVEDGCRRVVVQACNRPRRRGVEVIRLPRNEWIDPADVRAALGRVGFGTVLVEGGGITIARFLESRVLTRLHVAVAPLIIGSGAAALTTRPIDRLRDAHRPPTAIYGLGKEVLFDCDFAASARSIPASEGVAAMSGGLKRDAYQDLS